MNVIAAPVTDAKAGDARGEWGRFKGASAQDIFYHQRWKSHKKSCAHIGLSHFDYVELKDNKKPGDVVIVSDKSNLKRFEIKINQ